MMRGLKFLGLAWVLSGALSGLVWAQQADGVVWIQIEAHPSIATAEARAREIAAEIEDVNGFALGPGWYGIALGPYSAEDARSVLRTYRRQGLIPRDAFVAQSTAFSQQFWPEGADLLGAGTIAVPAATDSDETADAPEAEPPAAETRDVEQDVEQDVEIAQAEATEEAEPTPSPLVIDETPAEARRSERALSTEERKDLQIALEWAGFYSAGIDGAFGPGTRRAMSAWQEANGIEATGVLTTVQRAALLGQYNAVLDGLDLQTVRDATAGIELLMPMGVVEFETYDYPMARYAARGDVPAQVLLISQAGDQNTLFGLYEILQTLEIVPLNGPRERGNSAFTLTGENDEIVSYTEASLRNGEIKGFMLVWPAGDEARRTRLLSEMQESFERIDGVLDPSRTAEDGQAVDLVAGLQIRKPRLSRSGFFVDSAGTVVTTLEAVQGCARVTLDESTTATLASTNDGLGVAVLKPQTALAPRAFAAFAVEDPRLQSDIAVAGYSYGGVLGAPTMTFGALADVTGLAGEPDVSRLQLTALEGDVGGPVFDPAGRVFGMLLPLSENGRDLPENVQFAAKAARVTETLSAAGVTARTSEDTGALAPEAITARARDMTVLVSCWD